MILYVLEIHQTDDYCFGYNELVKVFPVKNTAEYVRDSLNEKLGSKRFSVSEVEVFEHTSMRKADCLVREIIKPYLRIIK